MTDIECPECGAVVRPVVDASGNGPRCPVCASPVTY